MKNLNLQASFKRQLEAIRELKVENSNKYLLNLDKRDFFKYRGDIYKVNKRTEYQESKNYSWFEIECYNINKDKIVFFELEEDDSLEISITLKELKLRDLNKSIEDIYNISEEKDGKVRYDSNYYTYDDDYKAKWIDEEKDLSYKVWFCDFYNEDLEETLTIEEWKVSRDDYEIKIYTSTSVHPDSIKVLN